MTLNPFSNAFQYCLRFLAETMTKNLYFLNFKNKFFFHASADWIIVYENHFSTLKCHEYQKSNLYKTSFVFYNKLQSISFKMQSIFSLPPINSAPNFGKMLQCFKQLSILLHNYEVSPRKGSIDEFQVACIISVVFWWKLVFLPNKMIFFLDGVFQTTADANHHFFFI